MEDLLKILLNWSVIFAQTILQPVDNAAFCSLWDKNVFYQLKYRKGIHLTDHDEVLKIEAVMYAKSVDVLMLSYW